MVRYMLQVSYNQQGISALISNPQDRAAVVGPLVESFGGKLVSFDYAFGEYDVVVIAEAPDNVTAAALVMAVIAGGAVKDVKTTVLITMEEAIEAMRRAGSVGYQPPA